MTAHGLTVAAIIMAVSLGATAWLAYGIRLTVEYDLRPRLIGWTMVTVFGLALFLTIAVAISHHGGN